MRILRASDRVAVPWKNGGGTTSEVAAYPEGASFDDFGWRISIARIDRGGPFSTFPGIDRKLAMLEGRVTLAIEGQGEISLSPDSPAAIFPGDVPTSAKLIESPASDLNVMTRRGLFAALMERRHLRECDLTSSSDAAARFCFFFSTVTARYAGTEHVLRGGDVLHFVSGESGALTLPAGADAIWIEIRAENPRK
ncbi:MAG: HutD/Ves family protein [Rhizomicrobium sp.]